MVNLKQITIEEKTKAYNLNQKYLYEMTNYYDNEFDSNGNIDYGYFDLYFTDSSRIPYFIYNDNTLVGFIFLNKYSHLGMDLTWGIAEATIFPMYRRNHYMADAVKIITDKYPGLYEVKYNMKNLKAKALWEGISSNYPNTHHQISECEMVIRFTTNENK